MADLFSNKAADNYRLARSGSIIEPDADTYNIIRLPQYAFVNDVWLLCTEAGSSDTVDVGFIGNGETADPDAFLDRTYALVNATGIGVYRASKDTVTGFSGKWFSDASGVVTITIGTTQTSGIFLVFVEYTVIH